MAYLGIVKLSENLTFYANTHTPSTGAAVDADAVPGYRVYEDETATPLLTGSMALLDDANTTGFYSETIAVTTANGFEAGKTYAVRITGVVGGVTGVELHQFQVTTRDMDDLAFPTTSGRSIDVDADGGVEVDSIQDGAITAAAIATGAIDADAIAADAIGASELAADAVAEIWAATSRTLTQSAASVTSAVAGTTLTVVRTVSFSGTISGLTIPATWSKILLTAKARTSDADSAAQIQIQKSVATTGDGLLYINGQTPTAAGLVVGDAALTVNQSAGTVAIVIDDEATVCLVAGTYSWDIKCLLADGTSQQLSGAATFSVTDAVTAGIT